MRRLICMLVLASLCATAGRSLAGDTGMYRILSYKVGLTPRSDGIVSIEYHQRWLVTGGHIPWITVGTPNSSFDVAGAQGAVSSIASAGEGGWSGVRLDLDKDYRTGQTFDVGFAIDQRKLFYASGGNFKLDFTPGWYDRAATDTLRISVKFFADPRTVVASPRPTSVSDDVMTWEKRGLAPGERFSIQVSFPAGSFPSGIAKTNLKGASGGGLSGEKGVFVFMFVAVIVIIVILAMFSTKRRYSGGNIFYGGMPGGRFGGGGSGRSRSAGGGGGFGGSSISCACACVSCACACACAGGGGAGCSRKPEHTCPACGEKRE
ncbi:MAG: hypothetical protein HY770_07250 [Chitinivibrionia bacterium]|nr:hypothetical protein [Chitinivibrionia bacterium]